MTFAVAAIGVSQVIGFLLFVPANRDQGLRINDYQVLMLWIKLAALPTLAAAGLFVFSRRKTLLIGSMIATACLVVVNNIGWDAYYTSRDALSVLIFYEAAALASISLVVAFVVSGLLKLSAGLRRR